MAGQITGAEIFLKSLVESGVDTIFGYPGGQILTVYDKLYGYGDQLHHILVRHEQGAVHAAQGFARATGRPGVVLVTSGPGATNVITGIADAMIDSTPIVVIAGQVSTALLGTDAFQETDVMALATPISKWTYQIRRPEDVADAVAKAFHIASSGRPGPVVLDFTRDAQVGLADFNFRKCEGIRSYRPCHAETLDLEAVDKAARLIDEAERPLVIFGHGILISHAENQLQEFLKKGGIPAASTLLGLSALPSDFRHYIGMVGMHGNIAANIMTQKADVIVAVGMRFDDRVTGKTSEYARNAKIIHIDIDESEIGKIVPVEIGICGDAAEVLAALTERISFSMHDGWESSALGYYAVENDEVISPEVRPGEGYIRMGEVVDAVATCSKGNAIVVTDVGQNQMTAARYSKFVRTDSFITSGGLGTMGFGIPAALGAKIGCPDRPVCLFVGDGGLQMTVEEFGTIMQERAGVKIVLLNNNWLGNVRMWQQLFYDEHYSHTRMLNPDFSLIAEAYGMEYRLVEKREDLEAAVAAMLADEKPWLLDVHVLEEGMVFPMVPPGKRVDEIMLTPEKWFDNGTR